MKSKTNIILELLRAYESRNVTFMDGDGAWPIVWERAKGVHVWDAEGRKYLDLTAAFGVAAAGHANPRVVAAGQRQMAKLLHAMGDVHPHALKGTLARELSRLTFERWTGKAMKGKTIFCNSGFEAVEAALKTARLASGKRGIIAFTGAYHGLGYGALNATHREFFRAPFRAQLAQFAQFVQFPSRRSELSGLEKSIRRLLTGNEVGAILVEPVQVRGGINIPPPGFLSLLRRMCDAHDLVLILDEIYTGFGRTGKWFACEHEQVVPDIICLGKALAGGFPLSACTGQAEMMDATWPPSEGEAIHTSTFLGHPVGCAMALAHIGEVRRLKLPDRSARLGRLLLTELSKVGNSRSQITRPVRGLGLLAGLEIREAGDAQAGAAQDVVKAMLRRGFILLPEGENGNVISFSPPLTIRAQQLRQATQALARELDELFPA